MFQSWVASDRAIGRSAGFPGVFPDEAPASLNQAGSSFSSSSMNNHRGESIFCEEEGNRPGRFPRPRRGIVAVRGSNSETSQGRNAQWRRNSPGGLEFCQASRTRLVSGGPTRVGRKWNRPGTGSDPWSAKWTSGVGRSPRPKDSGGWNPGRHGWPAGPGQSPARLL